MLLKDGNLGIRDAAVTDAAVLCGWWNDGGVMAHAGFPLGLGTDPETIARDLSTDSDQTHRRLILEVDGRPVGEMNHRNKGDGVVEIGIKICDPAQRDRGNGTRFLRMLIAYLFEVRGFTTVVLDTNLDNVRAQHVYEKLGFRRTSVHVDSWRNQLGVLQSQVCYEMRIDDFNR